MDSSAPGEIRITVSQSIGSGETSLCYLCFYAKEALTGTAYVAVSPESTLTNNDGTFLFSECTGLLAEVCLPDFNKDRLTDLRDFALLAKQYGQDDVSGERYDITGNGSIGEEDLAYLKELLFADMTVAEPLVTERVADRSLQAVYTVTSKMETRVTTYEYDAADRLISVTDCNGNSVIYDYDSCGRLVRVTDQAGYASEICYDTAGNPVRVVLPEGVTESYTYDTEGRLLTVTDSLGAVTSYGYDAYGRTVSVTDAAGVTTEYRYDIAGNVVKNLLTGEITCYNAYDEPVSYTDAKGNTTTARYNAHGNITEVTDALGGVTSYVYRKDGLLAEIHDASGAVTRYEYDSRGQLSKETDALGAVTSYVYDRDGRPVKVSGPDGTVTEYTYNTDGSITKVTAVKSDGEREELRYLYALDGSLTASVSSTDLLCYTYDSRGNVASVTKNGKHTVSLAYDGNGNLTLLKEGKAGTYAPDSITAYFYDAAGRLREVRTGGTIIWRTAGTDRNGFTIFTRTTEGGKVLASYVSRADGLTEQVTDGAGTVTAYQYNDRKQVTGLTVTSADGTVLYQEKNSYDKNGSLISQTVTGEGYSKEQHAYTYDALDRLMSETVNGQKTVYTYDTMGNRLTKNVTDGTGNSAVTADTAYVYDLCNRLLSETTDGIRTEYSYDASGNLTEKTDSTGTTTYAYDALNRLTEAVTPDGSWQRNTYDASGIRSMITENGITTEFMSFRGLVLSGYDKDGEQTEHYFYGSGLLAEETGAAGNGGGNGTGESGNTLLYYLKNSHGDVVGLTDSTGTLTGTFRYDAFGTLTELKSLNAEGLLTETDMAASRFLYAGEQYDAVTGLYYLRARYYDTTTGRFTQEDINLGDGRNLYVYVSSNPLKYTDPSGYEKNNVSVDDSENNSWSMPNWLKVTVGAAAIAGLAIATVCTGGTAAVICGAALSGAIVGGTSGAVIGAIDGGISDGWKGVVDGACSGFMSGTLVGGVTGATAAGLNIATGATTVVGNAHGSILHKLATNMEAGKMVTSGQYSQIGLNKALKTMGMNGTSRPDVIGIAKNGVNKLVEVVSPKQSTKYILNKMSNMLSNNSGSVGKVVTWVRKIFK